MGSAANDAAGCPKVDTSGATGWPIRWDNPWKMANFVEPPLYTYPVSVLHHFSLLVQLLVPGVRVVISRTC